jgi:hypothetical protein
VHLTLNGDGCDYFLLSAPSMATRSIPKENKGVRSEWHLCFPARLGLGIRTAQNESFPKSRIPDTFFPPRCLFYSSVDRMLASASLKLQENCRQ